MLSPTGGAPRSLPYSCSTYPSQKILLCILPRIGAATFQSSKSLLFPELWNQCRKHLILEGTGNATDLHTTNYCLCPPSARQCCYCTLLLGTRSSQCLVISESITLMYPHCHPSPTHSMASSHCSVIQRSGPHSMCSVHMFMQHPPASTQPGCHVTSPRDTGVYAPLIPGLQIHHVLSTCTLLLEPILHTGSHHCCSIVCSISAQQISAKSDLNWFQLF